jgi:hypothetical protein
MVLPTTLPAEQTLLPKSPSHQPDTWLDEEISSLLDAVGVANGTARASGIPARRRGMTWRSRRRRLRQSKLAYPVRAPSPDLRVRRVDVAFLVIGVSAALLIGWLVPLLSRP